MLQHYKNVSRTVADVEAEERDHKLDEISKELLKKGTARYRRIGFDDFMDIVKNIKLTLIEMVTNVSDFLNNIFDNANHHGYTKANSKDPISMGGIMGLTMLVVIMVLMKRA